MIAENILGADLMEALCFVFPFQAEQQSVVWMDWDYAEIPIDIGLGYPSVLVIKVPWPSSNIFCITMSTVTVL